MADTPARQEFQISLTSVEKGKIHIKMFDRIDARIDELTKYLHFGLTIEDMRVRWKILQVLRQKAKGERRMRFVERIKINEELGKALACKS